MENKENKSHHKLCVSTLKGENMIVYLPKDASVKDLCFFRKNIEEFFKNFLDELIDKYFEDEVVDNGTEQN